MQILFLYVWKEIIVALFPLFFWAICLTSVYMLNITMGILYITGIMLYSAM